MPGAPTILTLREFLKSSGKQKTPLIIYFDAPQWKNLTRGVKPAAGTPPKTGVQLALTTLPGLAGGFVEIRCPVGGPITGAGGELRCGNKPGVDFPDPGSTTLDLCMMSVSDNGNISCRGKCKRLGTCRKRSYGISFGPGGSSSAVLVLCQC